MLFLIADEIVSSLKREADRVSLPGVNPRLNVPIGGRFLEGESRLGGLALTVGYRLAF